ncbi:MAG: hypothetical protein AAB263_11790 [Planctomycetota bacterium]
MRWTMLILNILAAVAFLLLSSLATAAQHAHAYSTFRELEMNHVLVEKPTYTDGEPLNVEARLRTIGAGGDYYSVLGYLGAGACLLNGVIFFGSSPD